MPKTIEIYCVEVDGQYSNPNPRYSVHLTPQEIRGLKAVVDYNYAMSSIRGSNGFGSAVNDFLARLRQQFPNLDKGLGYKLCGQGEKAGDTCGLLHQNHGLFRRLMGIQWAACSVPEARLAAVAAEEIKERAAVATRQAAIAAAQRAAAEAARLAAIEAAAQAAAESVAKEAARLSAEAGVARRVAETATQRAAEAVAQQARLQTAVQDTRQLVEQLAVQALDAQGPMEAATENLARIEAERLATQERVRAEPLNSQHSDEYLLVIKREAVLVAARDAVWHAKAQHKATVEAQAAYQEAIPLAEEQIATLTTAAHAVEAFAQNAAGQVAPLVAQQTAAERVATEAAQRVVPVAARIKPAYAAVAQQVAEAQAKPAEVQALARLEAATAPLKQVADAAVTRVTEKQSQLTAVQKRAQLASQKATRLAAIEVEAQLDGKLAAHQSDIDNNARLHHTKEYFTQSKESARVRAYTSKLNKHNKEYYLEEKQQDRHPAVAAYAARVVAELAVIKGQNQEEVKKIMQGPQLTEDPGIPTRNHYETLIASYQAMLQFTAGIAAQEASQEVARLAIEQEEAKTTAEQALDRATQYPDLAHQSEAKTAVERAAKATACLTVAQEKALRASQETLRLAAQEAEAQQDAQKEVERFSEGIKFHLMEKTIPEIERALRLEYRAAAKIALCGPYSKAIQITDEDRAIAARLVLETAGAPLPLGHAFVMADKRIKVYTKTLHRLIDEHRVIEEEDERQNAGQVIKQSSNAVPREVVSRSAPPTASHSFKSLELILKYGFGAITSADHPVFHLKDGSISPAARLFALDLVYFMAAYAPQVSYNQYAREDEKALGSMQRFFAHPKHDFWITLGPSLLRMAAVFNPDAMARPTSKPSDVDFDLADPALETASQAVGYLQRRAKLYAQKNKLFFALEPDMGDRDRISRAKDAEFEAGFSSLEATARRIDPHALPVDIFDEIAALKARSEKPIAQNTMSC